MKKITLIISLLIVTVLALTNCSKSPSACCTVPGTGVVNQAVSMDATCSTNSSKYEWNFGDNSAKVTDVTTSHIYTAAGTYTVSLMAMNSDGSKMNTVTKTIKIN